MATIKVLPSGAFQIRVVSKLLPKPFYATFDSRAQAESYSDHLRKLLAQGIVFFFFFFSFSFSSSSSSVRAT